MGSRVRKELGFCWAGGGDVYVSGECVYACRGITTCVPPPPTTPHPLLPLLSPRAMLTFIVVCECSTSTSQLKVRVAFGLVEGSTSTIPLRTPNVLRCSFVRERTTKAPVWPGSRDGAGARMCWIDLTVTALKLHGGEGVGEGERRGGYAARRRGKG
jgi:hypothetical protein